MRERAFTTSVIWIALAVGIDRILASLRYTELVTSPGDPSRLIEQTAFVSTWWQIGAGFLIFMLIGCAMGATIAIWESAKKEDKAQQSEKAKRDAREARLKRLMATLDDEQLDALEQGSIGDDGERLSLESLMRRRD
jgi:flagellar biosynthesis/type III secretory pathway M-ring protein FliF/YscJ